MINSLLKKVNTLRKVQYFKNELFHSRKTYAFVGVGMHSINNLFPVLKHYNINIKYILTKSSRNPENIKLIFPNAIFTNNIEEILNDQEVEGVFICASPDAHFDLLKKCLEKSKKVFVEKPPCDTQQELQKLLSVSEQSVCKIGLQRRYWPGNTSLKNKITKVSSYSYQFRTGNYVNGSTLTGLFIHPLDYVLHLFGEGKIKSSFLHDDLSGITLQLHILHKNGISGLINCSSQGSWLSPTDELMINTSKEILFVRYPVQVEGEIKPGRILNIPAERILHQSSVKKQYYKADNFLLPVAEQNTLHMQGFYNELRTFILIVEGIDSDSEKNDLKGMVNLYNLFEELKKNYPMASL